VYEYNGANWVQIGTDIDGEAAGDNSGFSVSFNAAGTRVAIGAHLNDGNGSESGHVRVYSLDCSDFPCGNNNNEVLVCHMNPNNAYEICISKNAVPAHLAHGDFCGPCPSSKQGGTLQEEVSQEVILEAHPNPFFHSTTIHFSLPEKTHAILSIHDVTGRTVAILVDGELPEGTHSMDWNADVTSGIYFYRLSTDNATITKQVVPLR